MSGAARLGILGGMGPQATQVFYQRILDRTDAARDQDHLPTLIFSDTSIPDRTEAILQGDPRGCYGRLLADARLLESAGCTALAIPCNTSHYFVDRLQAAIGIPILHMIRATARTVARAGWKRAGILATDGTIQAGLYQQELSALGVTPVIPAPELQALVMHIIYDEIKRGEQGSREKFAAIDRHLRAQHCDGAVLACTELSVFRVWHSLPAFYLDAMEVLAEESITACGYPLRTV
ncbi:MAG: amino acid racemase [Oscillospiraceae bacterium]|nr:amino acid racemase [Oscillospiraceae bacterium]